MSAEPRRRLAAASQPLISRCDVLVLDLDGVVYVGTDAVPGAVANLARVRDLGVPCRYATNNASRPPAEVAEHLTSLGVPTRDEEVVTSSQAAARLVAERFGAGAAVLAVGGPGVALACRAAGLVVVDSALGRPAAVVQGYGRDIGWSDLAEVAYAVQAGSWWVATNTDATLPTERGPAPGNGSLVAAVRHAVDVDPVVAGKPEPGLFRAAAADARADAPLVVGDRLDTDVAGAVAAGQEAVLVLTGVHGPLDLLRAPAPQRPDFVTRTLAGLHEGHPGTEPKDGWWRCGDALATVRGGHLHVDEAARTSDHPADEQALDLLRAACAAVWSSGADGGGPAGAVTVPDAVAERWHRLRVHRDDEPAASQGQDVHSGPDDVRPGR